MTEEVFQVRLGHIQSSLDSLRDEIRSDLAEIKSQTKENIKSIDDRLQKISTTLYEGSATQKSIIGRIDTIEQFVSDYSKSINMTKEKGTEGRWMIVAAVVSCILTVLLTRLI